MAGEDADVCWICLCNGDDTGGEETVRVCACPRVCHKRCLGRWQLQNAGKREEKYCRFCENAYPDWRSSLTPGELTPSTPVMAVSVRGKVYKLRVRPGPEGKEDFKRQIRALLGFSADMDFDVIFECKTPHNGSEKVQLHGFEAFEAASWCAAVSAAKRKQAKLDKAAKAAAAAAAGAGEGGSSGGAGAPLVPTLSCPAALTMPAAAGSTGRPSSSGGSSSVSDESMQSASSSLSTICGSQQQQQVGAESALTHTSAFARPAAQSRAATGGAVAGAQRRSVRGQQQQQQQLPGAALPATASFLASAGSSLPHAFINEEDEGAGEGGGFMPASPPASAAVLADVSAPGCGPDQDACPASAARRSSGSGTSHHHHRHHALNGAQSVPVVGSGGALAVGSGRRRVHGISRRGSSGGASTSSDSSGSAADDAAAHGARDAGGASSKMPRWLRRLLHIEDVSRTPALPGSIFMGLI